MNIYGYPIGFTGLDFTAQVAPRPPMMTACLERLDAIDPSTSACVQKLFDAIQTQAQMGCDMLCASDAWDAFNCLITEQEFEVFAEVFNTYHEGRALQSDRRLRLNLPTGWTVRNPQAMKAALAKAVLPSLEVFNVVRDHGADRTQSADVSTLIVCFLEGGTTHLDISAPLTHADSVAEAIVASRLQSANLSFGLRQGPVPLTHLHCHNTLLSGLANCRTLHTLDLQHLFCKAATPLASFQRQESAALPR